MAAPNRVLAPPVAAEPAGDRAAEIRRYFRWFGGVLAAQVPECGRSPDVLAALEIAELTAVEAAARPDRLGETLAGLARLAERIADRPAMRVVTPP